MEKKNTGLIVTIIILVICVLGLTGYIIYDKVLNDNTDVQENNNNKNIDSPLDFINKIGETENKLKTNPEYTISYNDLSFTAYRNDNNIIENIVIKYKGKQINKDTRGDAGFHTLKSYYLNKDTGLFIITLFEAPMAANPNTYIVSFDTNGNIKIDDKVQYNIDVDTDESTLTYKYELVGPDCNDSSITNPDEIYSSIITYKYLNNEIEEISKEEKTIKDLPNCEY